MRPRQLLGICLAGLAALYLLELLYHGVLSVVYPYDLNYGEGYVLNDALRLVRGEPVWADITQFPMVRSAYPPLFLAITGLLSAASPSFFSPRLVSLLAALAIGAMLVWYGRRTSAGWLPAIAAGGLWVGSTFVYQWAPLARVDMLGLAFSLAPVLLVEGRYPPPRPSPARGEGEADGPHRSPLREGEGAGRPASPPGSGRATPANDGPSTGEGVASRSSTMLLLAALLCSLALLTKQTFLAGPLAIVLFLALRRDRRAFWFAGTVALIVGGATLALNAATAGQYAQHVLFGNAANPYRLDRTYEMVGLFLRINAIAVLATFGYFIFRPHRMWTPVTLYVPLALATLLTAGNVSSDVNYFLEPTVALALAIPLAWEAAENRVRPSLLAGLAVAQLALLIHFPNGFMAHYPPGPAKGSTPVEEDERIGERIEALVRDAGPNAVVELAGFAVHAGVPVWIQPIDLQAEQRRGGWTPDLLNASIAEHRWSVVVLSYKFLPPESLATLEREYEQTEGLASPNGFSYFVYRPRS